VTGLATAPGGERRRGEELAWVGLEAEALQALEDLAARAHRRVGDQADPEVGIP
jgi:hypothetical protein